MPNKVARVKPVWRVFWDSLGSDHDVFATANNDGFAAHDIITAAEVEDLDDNVLLKRIVGEVSFNVNSQDNIAAIGKYWICFGLLVEDTQYDAGTMALSTAPDAQDAPWLWLRTYYGGGSLRSFEGGNNLQPLTDGGGLLSTHIDIKVARRLRAGDTVRLKVQARAQDSDWRVTYCVNLRVLLEA